MILKHTDSDEEVHSAQEFSVSVPENVAVGEAIFSLPENRAAEKAELPCAKVEGDPYGRFNVTGNCTVVVANPLDWSVQLVYLLKLRSGVDDTTVKVELTDVEGYPPVYNETCETPVNHDSETGDLLYSIAFAWGAVTTVRTQTYELANAEYLDVKVKPVGCPVGQYGFLCDKTCICKNGARCHGFNGACKCPPGWKGVACDIPKQDVSITTTPSDPRHIYISANLTFHCKAHHVDVTYMSVRYPNATEKVGFGVTKMDFVVPNIQPTNTGRYSCQVRDTRGNTLNTTFVLNVTNCAPDRKGAGCEEVCGCLQGASCDRWAGCVCPPGWTGTRCQTQCLHGTYDKDCARKCTCQNGANCSPSDGRCDCTDGWYGRDCSKPCLTGRFGQGCSGVCTCKNNATCSNVDGSCTCVRSWTGENCDQWQTSKDEPLLEILVPLGSLVVLVAIVTVLLYKTGILSCSAPDAGEEEKILFELRRMEQDLAQSLQPGWLKLWEKKLRHLTPGPLIGEGMFGLVRKAQLRTPEGEIAVAAKTVRVENSQSYRDFYREAAILVAVHQERNGDCRESNIVRLVGLITKSTEKYILLEYAPKGDLLRLLRRIPNVNEGLLGSLLGYAVDIARALQELGRLRIAHRDVAARNVLITADGAAKLADFGLARDVYTSTQYVRRDSPGVDELLPLKWMALESIETGEYTCQSDVWSFGVLLWEIATLGKDPCYDGRTQLSFLQMVGILRQGKRMAMPEGCPEDLYRLMRSCWRDDPDTRPTPEGIEERLMQLKTLLLVANDVTRSRFNGLHGSATTQKNRFCHTAPLPPASTAKQTLETSEDMAQADFLSVLPYVAAVGVAVGLYFLRRHVKGEVCRSDVRLNGKTAIVTGANTGIGKATAQELADRGARVILACRDMAKAKKAASDIRQATGNGNVVAWKLDLASLTSVRAFAGHINTEEERLDILVNNAAADRGRVELQFGVNHLGVMWCPQQQTEDGFELQFGVNHLGVMWCPQQQTEDGFELQFGVNHLGHFLLTNLLLDKLRKSAPSRVVTVSAVGHKSAHIDFGNLNGEKSYSPYQANFQSKLANALFSRELAKRTRGRYGHVDVLCGPRTPSSQLVTEVLLLAAKAPPKSARSRTPVTSSEEGVQKTLKRTGVMSFSVDPGPVRTELARHMPQTLGPVLYRRFGVSAFSVDPGPVRTELARHMPQTLGPVLEQQSPRSELVKYRRDGVLCRPGASPDGISPTHAPDAGPGPVRTGVSAFSVDPGPVRTELARHMPGPGAAKSPFTTRTGVSAFSVDLGPVRTELARHMPETLGPVLFAPLFCTGVMSFSVDPRPVRTELARHMPQTLGPVLELQNTGVSAFSVDPGPVRTDLARHMPQTLGPVLYAFRTRTGVSAFSVDPGPVRTELARHMPQTLGPVLYPLFWLVMKLIHPIVKTPREGAQTSLHCAVAEGLENYSGMYFKECTPAEPAPQAKDDAVARRLWEVSEEMVGMKT
ncbi:Endothelial cell-specific molecule 1 [Branchiostoma belcheri]|nr:Endothelial cell-specific molecule 1 [Branchiostoma belcheri]